MPIGMGTVSSMAATGARQAPAACSNGDGVPLELRDGTKPQDPSGVTLGGFFCKLKALLGCGSLPHRLAGACGLHLTPVRAGWPPGSTKGAWMDVPQFATPGDFRDTLAFYARELEESLRLYGRFKGSTPFSRKPVTGALRIIHLLHCFERAINPRMLPIDHIGRYEIRISGGVTGQALVSQLYACHHEVIRHFKCEAICENDMDNERQLYLAKGVIVTAIPPLHEAIRETLCDLAPAFERLADWIAKNPDVAGVGAMIDFTLHDDDVSILRHLSKCPEVTKSQYDIEVATDLSRKTIGHRLDDLRVRGLTRRPKGERGGEAITPEGLKLLAQIDAR